MPFTDQRRIEWLMQSENPALKPGDLHLWRVNLELLGGTAGLEQILSPDESARSERLLSPEKRAAFIAGRAALRLILAKYLRLDPGAIRFKYSGNGKPSLTDSSHSSDIQFNLSHSGRWMVLGVCRDSELGLDIEEVRPVQTTWALDQLFADEERKFLAALPQGEKHTEFIAVWTGKEAAAKVNGGGLSGNAAGLVEKVLESRKQTQDGFTFFRRGDCWFIQFEPAPRYTGCAAVQTDLQPRVTCFEFLPAPHQEFPPSKSN